ncbi:MULTISPECIES: NINE protein [Nesterenkonia]|uniref:TM2 domain-containing membrane protein YozV n=1 Tax=Nesterenkonia xinjiangensis TaxID=225327 RepID=A0A7Z0K8U5_9MICC|nr:MULTISPECIES: NINE protein [Nesterenkonia]MDZ5078598.1 TM2 domain-containing protein [Nesterenkonia sp. HG001]NYJ76625.1 TM2 domain-containing membrane protein YozV [Nesterenkonia xinjiangensis]
MASRAYDGPQKDPGIALVLTIVGFFFVAGLQYFYLGKILMGLLFLFTLGFLYVGTVISLFTIRGETRRVNYLRARGMR